MTIALAGLLATIFWKLLTWAIFDAVWSAPAGDSTQCRALSGRGACWALIAEKHRFLLFATYPYEQHWRPATVCAILFVLYLLSAARRLGFVALCALWVAGLTAIGILMWGGVLGLSYVPTSLWGGLPVTLLLATFGIAVALPIGVLLALGRQARSLPVVRFLCVGYIELIRGVPLVSVLFMASFLVPLLMPASITIDKLLRTQIAFILFVAAYLAEVVRGGLLSIPRGQDEAARALGLRYWPIQALVILPQALRAVIPPLVNTSISLLKGTSLILIIGLFDLLNAGKAAVVDPVWQGFGLEMYLVVSLIYFVLCFAMSRYSQHLERKLARR